MAETDLKKVIRQRDYARACLRRAKERFEKFSASNERMRTIRRLEERAARLELDVRMRAEECTRIECKMDEYEDGLEAAQKEAQRQVATRFRLAVKCQTFREMLIACVTASRRNGLEMTEFDRARAVLMADGWRESERDQDAIARLDAMQGDGAIQ